LLAFSVPVVLAIIVQAFLSRAHANWAAVAYVAATVLVIATMIRDTAWGWLKASFVINVAVIVVLVLGVANAGQIRLPLGLAPFARTIGWEDVAGAVREEVAAAAARGAPYAAILSDDRPMTAELLYYLRDSKTPIYAWRETPKPRDHFELVRPFNSSVKGPVLLATLFSDRTQVPNWFEKSVKVGEKTLPAGVNATRRVTLIRLSGYKGE
jgi:hypothetical protein